jgi:hypothetical protein
MFTEAPKNNIDLCEATFEAPRRGQEPLTGTSAEEDL